METYAGNRWDSLRSKRNRNNNSLESAGKMGKKTVKQFIGFAEDTNKKNVQRKSSFRGNELNHHFTN
jgi:hypothetical protein